MSGCDYEKRLNSYDNSLLYTDFLIADMAKFLQNLSGFDESSIFYISDHGESLGENGVFMHGLEFSKVPIEQLKIAAMFYFSDKLKAEHFANIANKPFSHDNLFHTTLGFFEISTKIYDKSLDMFQN